MNRQGVGDAQQKSHGRHDCRRRVATFPGFGNQQFTELLPVSFFVVVSAGYRLRAVLIRSQLPIPVKSTSDSDRRRPAIPEQSVQRSERSDAGVDNISEVDDFSQTRTYLGLSRPPFLP